MSSDENEFGSDDDDEEINLYTQLYFGDNFKVEENLQPNKIDKISNNEHPNKFKAPYSGNEQSTEINEIELPPIKNIHTNLLPKKDNSVSTNSVEKVLNDTTLKKLKMLSNAEKHKRKRNPSICSTDSISGREPLDNLYCQIDDEILSPLEEEISDEPHCDVSLELKKSVNASLEKDNSQNILSEIINPKSKPKLKNKVVIESSDEEVDVIDLSSDDSIEVIKCVTQKTPEKTKKKAAKLRKRQKKLVSYDSKSDILDSPQRTPLVFRFGSEIISTEEKKMATKKFSKSCIIYTRNRPLTKKTPSCPLWTPEMASFYDSDYSDDFSVEDIHRTQKKNPKLWKICAEDYRGPTKRSKSRYFDERCTRCKDFGHNVNSCPRTPHCCLCSVANHTSYNCPEKCCLYCGKRPPHKICTLAFRSNICSECKQYGHVASICPDLWRRFHATTSGSVPVIPDKNKPSMTRNKDAYCYNCAKKGHFGHECKAGRSYDYVTEYKNKFCSVSTQIFDYSSEFPSETNETFKLNTEQDEIEVLTLSKKTKLNEKKADFTSCLPVTKRKALRFLERRATISREIGKIRSGIQSITVNMDENKIVFEGSKKSVPVAERVVTLLMGKTPSQEYKSHIETFNNQEMKLASKKAGESPSVKGSPTKIIVQRKGKRKVFCGQQYIGPNNERTLNVFQKNFLEPSLPASLSLYFQNTENLFLPAELPSKKRDILEALDKALMTYSARKRRVIIVDKLLKYFSGDFRSICTKPEFLSKFQQLSCIADFQSSTEGKSCVCNTLFGLKRKLKPLNLDDSLDSEHYHKYSRCYSKLSSPNIKYIYEYLVLANRYQEQRSQLYLKDKRKSPFKKKKKKKKNQQQNES